MSEMKVDNKTSDNKLLGTEDLKRVLGRKELMSIAIGQIIGAGVFALTGIVIGTTGRSVNLAFMIAAVLVVLLAIPLVFIGGTIRMRGGQYTQAALLIGERFAGFYMIVYLISNLSVAMYAISFSEYLVSLIPSMTGTTTIVALVVLTGFYVLNFFGIQGAAKMQNLLVVLMAAALSIFIVFGIGKIQPGYFQQPGWMTGGTMGFLTGIALLQYATGGATVVVNFGAESKNPTKDIPIVIVVSTLGVAAVYGLMATIAAGVLPIEVTAFQPLTAVAREILPTGLLYFFIIAGAGFALTTTLNATLGWVTKPLLQATIDGWFPKSLGKIHPKYKTPYVWLTIVYVIGVLTILSGWDIGQIANFALVLINITGLVLSFSAIRLPKVVPEIWEKSSVHVSTPVLWAGCLLAVGASLFQIVVLGLNQTPTQLIGNVVILAVAIIFSQVRHKHVKMEISYEEA